MQVRLQNDGICVQRERVRQAMRRVDPAGVALRSRRAVKRRTYHVKGPNSLWHLDGNHKLIRYPNELVTYFFSSFQGPSINDVMAWGRGVSSCMTSCLNSFRLATSG